MNTANRIYAIAQSWFVAAVFIAVPACAGNPAVSHLENGRFVPCPDSPNCVSSDAVDEAHRVEPYRLKVSPRDGWHGLQNVIAAQDLKRLIVVNDVYLHIEVESPVMRFVDDTEFHLRPDEGVIAVRSAARNRKSDGGSNRERVENIRKALQARGLVE